MAFGSTPGPETIHAMQTGMDRIVREQFSGGFPDASQFERAIAAVEDEVMQKWPLPAGVSQLVVFDRALTDVALASGHSGHPFIALDVDAMERVFHRLAAVIYGSPASRQGIPHDPVFAAHLLIVRELMHHQHVRAILLAA